MTNTADNFEKKSSESIIWFTVLPPILHIFRFISSIILARILSPHDFGIMGIITVMIHYSNNISNFGLTNAVIQRTKLASHHIDAFFCFNIGISTILFLLFYFLSPSIASYFNIYELETATQVFATMFLITALSDIPQAILQRELDYKFLALIEAVNVFLSIIISLVLALNGFGYWSIIIATIASNFVAMLLMIIKAKIRPHISIKHQYLKDLMSFGVWDFIWGQSKIIGDHIDKLIIGKYLGSEQLGYYDKAASIAQMPNDQIAKRVAMVSFSTFSRCRHEISELKKHFSKAFSICAFLNTPLYIGLFLVAEDFTLLILGEKWTPMIPVFKIFSLSFLIMAINEPISALNRAAGKLKIQTISRIILLIVLITNLIYFADQGTLTLSYIILYFNFASLISSFIILQTVINLAPSTSIKLLLPPTLSVTVMYLGITAYLQFYNTSGDWFSFILSITIGATIYTACFFLIPFSEWNFLRANALNKLQGKFS
ncbi:lipopolysaccharide biosynthesis protein [Dasania sp. GY-MA-18]|uniref:Lipopolysaccharide biosynthesis protein n=1 Tax=Dasania phycosphaerae TaxID=2950436 RepID=A0A9J6RR92_9GAMM|nr:MULTISPECIES: lipopolysaccharide biosynthesis protein [Dasania]MCR8924115.1 lipopolysaccharide biosynthesis protein [Dasania sp. GY-MA-18]MCZ0866688.1 lipopolysaccharide biosynthesis protein [Dasania phycosphaerae]MCZ0870273.1 lipopolysaccharide biosynthesis protein [Dasania phycosphaerae]